MPPAWVVQGLIVSCFTTLLVPVLGHGRLWEPPSRSSMWRLGYNTPVNYQDMELFCGGVGVQYDVNGGKCGVCGDPWNGPRKNEAGGMYANGIIVRSYKVGEVINITVELTANHKGIFEFHICQSDNPFENVTEECLARHPLTEETTGKIKYPVPITDYNGKFNMKFRLPAGVTCRACMLQWKYTAGNSWGTYPNGTSCIGCGNQEQFYGCSDIAIGHDDVVLAVSPTKPDWYTEQTTGWAGVSTTDGAHSLIFQLTVGSVGVFCGINVVIVVSVSFAAL